MIGSRRLPRTALRVKRGPIGFSVRWKLFKMFTAGSKLFRDLLRVRRVRSRSCASYKLRSVLIAYEPDRDGRRRSGKRPFGSAA